MPEKKQAIYVYSAGERFVGLNIDDLPVTKFADSTLFVFIEARYLPDPADKSDFPLKPGYDPEVQQQILDCLPDGWLEEIFRKKVFPALERFTENSEKYKYLQIMVMCGAGYQRSPAIAKALQERLNALEVLKIAGVKIGCFHLTAEMAHWIKTEVGLR